MSNELSPDDLVTKLREQRGFLRASAERFDAGDESEAVRLAVTVRVLVHDTLNSRSLLGLLGIKNSINYVDTSVTLPPDEHVPPAGGQPGHVSRSLGLGVARFTSTGGGPWTIVPLVEDHPVPREVNFDTWWSVEVARGPRSLSRQTVVLALANQEGGAHVDPVLDEDWAIITRAGSFSNVTAGVETKLNPAPAMMRQIAHELDVTLTKQAPEWEA